MAPPNLLGNTSPLYIAEPNSAEPVQIIAKPSLQNLSSLPQIRPEVRAAKPRYRWQVVWRNVIIFVYLHVAAIYGMYYFFTIAQWKTKLWVYVLARVSGYGVTVGAHRLWAHRCYKARLPLRILLAIGQTIALQNDIYEWVRDHRVHHKFTDTDADPHNSRRGFFFSHMGWLMVKKHKDVFVKGKTVDMSDVEADPVVRFQRKYYLILAPLFCFVLPSLIPWYFWNENLSISWYTSGMFRYVFALHCTWLVNSAAHIWGNKPFDKYINATENKTVAYFTAGEGWHNYHHVFPWDYKAAELGNYRFNFSTAIVDLMAKIGWAYDLKTVPIHMVMKRAKRTGDGSRKYEEEIVEQQQEDHHDHGDNIWGWGDKDMTQEDISIAEVHHLKEE